MGVRATCPHCGSRTSAVRINMRCSCGWADPGRHMPYRRQPEIDLSDEELEAVANGEVLESVIVKAAAEIGRPHYSSEDGEPVFHMEPYALVEGDDLPIGVDPEVVIRGAVERRAAAEVRRVMGLPSEG